MIPKWCPFKTHSIFKIKKKIIKKPTEDLQLILGDSSAVLRSAKFTFRVSTAATEYSQNHKTIISLWKQLGGALVPLSTDWTQRLGDQRPWGGSTLIRWHPLGFCCPRDWGTSVSLFSESCQAVNASATRGLCSWSLGFPANKLACNASHWQF